LIEKLLAMSVVISQDITGVCLSLSNTSEMAFKSAESKDTIESTTGVATKQVSMSLPTYEHIKFFIEDIKMIWQ